MILYIDSMPTEIVIEYLDTLAGRLIGLMGKSQIKNYGIILKPCNSIHTFFMRFSIDAIFLNKEMKVVKIVKQIKPWRIVVPVKNADMVLEISAGHADRFNLTEGCSIYIK